MENQRDKSIYKKHFLEEREENNPYLEALELVSLIGEKVLPQPYSAAFVISRAVGKNNPTAAAWISGITFLVFAVNNSDKESS